MHVTRSDAFKKAMCVNDGPFMAIHHGIRNDWDQMFPARVETLIADLDDIFRKTQYDVDKVCSTKEDDSPEGKKMREELLALLPEARQLLKDGIWKHLALCRERKE